MEQVVQQLQAQVQNLTNQLAAVQQQAVPGGMADAVAAIRELAQAQAHRERPTLVDTKGLGRPKVFNKKRMSFKAGLRKRSHSSAGCFQKQSVFLSGVQTKEERWTRTWCRPTSGRTR